MLSPSADTEKSYDYQVRPWRRETPLGEYLGAKFSQGYDWTVTRYLTQDVPLKLAEIGQAEISEEDYKASPYYREAIPYTPGMTRLRAAVYAENYDARRYRESLIDRSPGGLRSAAGFGVMLASQFLDPVNFIPFGALAGKAAAGTRVGKAVAAFAKAAPVRARMLAGGFDAAIGTAVTDPVLIHELNRQGEDVGWTDAAMDIAFGAMFGSLFGAAHAAFKTRKVRSARRRAKATFRAEVARAAEKAVADFDAGRPVDVARVVQPAEDNVRRLADTIQTLERRSAERQAPTIPERLKGAWEVMKSEVANGEPGRAIRRDDGSVGYSASTYPEWFRTKDKTWSRKEFDALVAKAESGQAMTAAQYERFEQLLSVADDYTRRLPDFVEEEGVLAMQRAGFEVVGMRDMAVGDLNPGDEVMVYPHAGAPSERYRHTGYDAQGNARLLDGKEIVADPFEVLSVEGIKRHPRPVSYAVEPEQPPVEVKKTPEDAPLAEHVDPDLAAGRTPELDEVDQLRQEGRLSEEDEAWLKEADSLVRQADDYQDAYLAAAGCVYRRS